MSKYNFMVSGDKDATNIDLELVKNSGGNLFVKIKGNESLICFEQNGDVSVYHDGDWTVVGKMKVRDGMSGTVKFYGIKPVEGKDD